MEMHPRSGADGGIARQREWTDTRQRPAMIRAGAIVGATHNTLTVEH